MRCVSRGLDQHARRRGGCGLFVENAHLVVYQVHARELGIGRLQRLAHRAAEALPTGKGWLSHGVDTDQLIFCKS